MSPAIHLFASWIIATKTTDNPRDCRLATLAGILPDLDGAGLVLDAGRHLFGVENVYFYETYHHFLLHGIFGGAGIALLLGLFAQRRGRVMLLSLALFHLHLLCDLVGSRGPSPEDLWPIFYLGPATKNPMWIWSGQWELNSWFNRLIALLLFAWTLVLAVRRGDSFVGVFSRRLDAGFVSVLKKWFAGAGNRGDPS